MERSRGPWARLGAAGHGWARPGASRGCGLLPRGAAATPGVVGLRGPCPALGSFCGVARLAPWGAQAAF